MLCMLLCDPASFAYYYMQCERQRGCELAGGGEALTDLVHYMFFLFYCFILRKDTCPPNHINVTNSWKEEKEVRTGVGKD